MSIAPATSSDLLAASAAVNVGSGRLWGLQVVSDGTNAATVVIYDNATAASGKVLAKVFIKAGGDWRDANFPEGGLVFNNGLYCSITGTGAAAIVWYSTG